MSPPASSTFQEIASSEFEDERLVGGSAAPLEGRLVYSVDTLDSDGDMGPQRRDLLRTARHATVEGSPAAVADFGNLLLQSDVARGYNLDGVLSLRGESARIMLDAIQMVRYRKMCSRRYLSSAHIVRDTVARFITCESPPSLWTLPFSQARSTQ